jgi:C4-dicarboxylate transporter, DctQ subunit
VTQLFASLAPAGVFFPLFAALLAVVLGVRWIVRRRVGKQRWILAVRWIEGGALALLILAMLSGAMLQIVLRNVFKTGLVWIEPLLRHLVLWIGFTAAVVVTGRLRHVHMDIVGQFLPPEMRRHALRMTTMAAALICAVLARAAWIYLGQEHEFGSTGFLGLPVWALTCVIFLGFALMAGRFASRALAGDDELEELEREVHGEAGLRALAEQEGQAKAHAASGAPARTGEHGHEA